MASYRTCTSSFKSVASAAALAFAAGTGIETFTFLQIFSVQA
jgi:hypothetical protein